MTARPADLVVVGGGAAGLVAARRAARDGQRVVVLEAGALTGGMLRPGRLGDLTIDIGAEAFATRGGAVEALVAELGLADDVVEPNRLGSWAVADGEAYRLPLAGLLGIPADPSADEVVAALGPTGAAAAAADAGLPPEAGLDAPSLAALVRARMGDAVVDRLVTPVARGVYSIDPDELDHRVLAPRLATALAESGRLSDAVTTIRAAAPPGAAVRGVRGGMHRVVRALDRELVELGAEIRTNAPVVAVEGDGPLRAAVLADGTRVVARAVLVTVPELAASVLAGDGTGVERASGDAADRPVPAEVVALLVASPGLDEAPRGTGVLVGAPAGDVHAKALTHVTAKWDWLRDAVPDGLHVLRLSYGPGDDPSALRTRGLAEAALRERAARDASLLLGRPIALDDVRAVARHEWRIPAPAARIGRRDRLEALRERARTLDGIDVAGTWIDGTGLATVLPAAEAAARRLAGA